MSVRFLVPDSGAPWIARSKDLEFELNREEGAEEEEDEEQERRKEEEAEEVQDEDDDRESGTGGEDAL